MFYEIRLKEDREKVAGILVKNGYAVTPARVKIKDKNSYRYGLDITGDVRSIPSLRYVLLS